MALSAMPMQTLPSTCARGFSTLRRALTRIGMRIRARPRLAAWFFPPMEPATEAERRKHNGLLFADFHEQERMLADQRRMAFYAAAISRHIQPGDRVVDLGTGTGILAALAARRGASKVYAIDHSEILSQARSLAKANGVRNVEFHSIHSTQFRTREPVDVILHEQMGDCLFDESMAANVTDLRDRLLKPGGLILPSLFDFYCEPIKVNDVRLVPFIWELEVQGYDFSCLERDRPQNPGYYHLASCDPGLIDHFLGDPEPALSIDLHTLDESALPREITITRTIVNAGRLDGYAVFFRARVDHDLTLSSSPLDPNRAPHWGFRILRTDRDDFCVGDTIDVRLAVGSWADPDSWRWSHVKRSHIESGLAGLRP
jgi:type I protein arginine methyltransferase